MYLMWKVSEVRSQFLENSLNIMNMENPIESQSVYLRVHVLNGEKHLGVRFILIWIFTEKNPEECNKKQNLQQDHTTHQTLDNLCRSEVL